VIGALLSRLEERFVFFSRLLRSKVCRREGGEGVLIGCSVIDFALQFKDLDFGQLAGS